MTAKRDSVFPSSSIGRAQGASINRTDSRDTLSAHPLLSSQASGSSAHLPLELQAPPANALPKYVPYTPRQRVVTTSATTGTTVHPSVSVSPQQPHGGATSRLQLVNLKAAAQGIGLDTGSVGWAILEKITEGDASEDWTEVWTAITKSKASLLLPLEQATGHEKITADFVRDHVVLCDGPSRDDVPVITLSGLRGIIIDETLTFRSTIPPSSKFYQDLLNSANSRSSVSASIPPLPQLPKGNISYPTFSLPAYTHSLPLLPRSAGLAKPPLPPRPNARPSSSQGSSRLANPFASFFSGPKSSSTSPGPISIPLPGNTENVEHIVEVSAFSIDKSIYRIDIGRDINNALKSELQDDLAGFPHWVVERVLAFVEFLYPFVKSSKKTLNDLGSGSNPPKGSYKVNTSQETAEGLSEKFQEFYALLEQDLRANGSPMSSRRREDPFVEIEHDKERQDREHAENDFRIRKILETVERAICTLLYDRLFLPLGSDDASHDEALSSRIAALNMVDLGLSHLDIDTGNIGPDLDVVVMACGETLCQLDVACRSPADKASILLAAHKVVVDGLSKLPPIRLKSEGNSQSHNADEPLNKVSDSVGEHSSNIKSKTEPTERSEGPSLLTSSPSLPILSLPEQGDATMSIPSIKEPPASHMPSSQSSLNSPLLNAPPLPETTVVSGDVLLPVIIFSVVKANPPHLVSHLLFTQRFRNRALSGGEESYCLINLMAVAEFLENVDLGALGLGESEKKVISTADLTPIPINRNITSEASELPQDGLPASLRGRVEQQVDAIAGSANKVISGVVDSSFGVLRSLLPNHTEQPAGSADAPESTPWNMRPGLGLLRRESFSIAGLAASLPGTRERSKSVRSMNDIEESGQQLVAVTSRPGSVKSLYVDDEEEEGEASSKSDEEQSTDTHDDDEEDEDDEDDTSRVGEPHDTRSIKSFESMMSSKGPKIKDASGRPTLTDRLAFMSGLSRLSSEPSRQAAPMAPRQPSLQVSGAPRRLDSPERTQSPVSLRLPPPNKRFLECAEADLKISEVGDLLREYRRLVENVRAVGGFEE